MKKYSPSSLLAICFILLLLFASQNGVEARRRKKVCKIQSHVFRGLCFRDHKCALVCRDEGFSGGRCSHFRRRCMCTKFCHHEISANTP